MPVCATPDAARTSADVGDGIIINDGIVKSATSPPHDSSPHAPHDSLPHAPHDSSPHAIVTASTACLAVCAAVPWEAYASDLPGALVLGAVGTTSWQAALLDFLIHNPWAALGFSAAALYAVPKLVDFVWKRLLVPASLLFVGLQALAHPDETVALAQGTYELMVKYPTLSSGVILLVAFIALSPYILTVALITAVVFAIPSIESKQTPTNVQSNVQRRFAKTLRKYDLPVPEFLERKPAPLTERTRARIAETTTAAREKAATARAAPPVASDAAVEAILERS